MRSNAICLTIPLILLAMLALNMMVPFVSVASAQEQKVVLRTHGWWQPPPVRRYNPFAPKAIRITGIFTERLAMWNKKENEFLPWLATSWEVKKDENKIIIHLRDDVYWHDGTKFTAKDVWTTLMIYKLFGRSVWKYISDVVVVDDYTVEYHVKEWGYLILYYVLYRDGEILAPYHIYGTWAERIAEAETQEELNNIKVELIEFEPETIIGTGPFKFVKITSSEMIAEKFDNHWAADKIAVDEIVFPYITSNEVGWLHYQAGDLDYDVFMMPPSVEEQISKLPFAEIIKVYDLSGFALVFNFNNEYLQDMRVRQAIAYVIDREKVAYAAGGSAFEPVDYPTGILKVIEDKWIGDIKEHLDQYSTDTSKAEQLLIDAGFTKGEDGKWRTPDGNIFTLTLIAPSGYTDWVAAAREIVSELKSFGIEVELKTPETSSYWSDQWYFGGNYDLALDFFGAWMTYPWAAFERMFIKVHNYPRTQIQGGGFSIFYDIDLGGPFTGKANVSQLVEILATSWDEDEQKEAAGKLAWIANHYLPQYPIAEKKLMIFYNKEHFIWPDPEEHYDLWQNAAGGHLEALGWMIINGHVKPNPSYWQETETPTTTPPETSPTSPPSTTSPTTPVTVTVSTGVDVPVVIGIAVIMLIIGFAISYFIKKK